MAMTKMLTRRLAAGLMLSALLSGAQPAPAQAEQIQRERAERVRDRDRGGDRNGGGGRAVRRVRAYQTDHVRVWLSAGRHEVRVRGDGDTDLDLYVRDHSGRTLAVDEGVTDYCRGSFFLRRGGYVEIRVRNLGRVYNQYELVVR